MTKCFTFASRSRGVPIGNVDTHTKYRTALKLHLSLPRRVLGSVVAGPKIRDSHQQCPYDVLPRRVVLPRRRSQQMIVQVASGVA